MKKLFRFLIAGGIGFVVDAGILLLLLRFTPIGPFGARAIAIPSALLATWFLNRNFTFGHSERSLAVEGFRYGSVGFTSALLNYALYSSLRRLRADASADHRTDPGIGGGDGVQLFRLFTLRLPPPGKPLRHRFRPVPSRLFRWRDRWRR